MSTLPGDHSLAEPPQPVTRTRTNGRRAPGVPIAPRRQRNTMWMIVGAFLVLASGLAAATVFRSLSSRVEVLVAARAIGTGEVIDVDDLETASLSADGNVRAISPADRDDLLGQVAAGPIGQGAIVHRSNFVEGNDDGQPQVIIGAALDAGQYPLAGLRPGDRVKIIEVSGPNATFDDSLGGAREVTEGEVVETRKLARSDALLVSLRVNEAIATPLSERAQQGRLRLALVDEGLLDDPVVPIDPAAPAEPGEPTEADQ